MSRHSIYHSSLSTTNNNLASSTQPNSIQSTSTSSSTSTTLQARIAQKRAELHSLQQLRDLSSQLASQMAALEQRLATLRDGTEAVACVLGNWDSVLGVIGLVGAQAGRLAVPEGAGAGAETGSGGAGDDGQVDGDKGGQANEEKMEGEQKQRLPETLVRIPVQNGNEDGDGDRENGESGFRDG